MFCLHGLLPKSSDFFYDKAVKDNIKTFVRISDLKISGSNVPYFLFVSPDFSLLRTSGELLYLIVCLSNQGWKTYMAAYLHESHKGFDTFLLGNCLDVCEHSISHKQRSHDIYLSSFSNLKLLPVESFRENGLRI